MKPAGKLEDVPGQWREQRLGFIVHGQGREVAPGGISAGQLHGSGEKNESAQQPAEKPDDDRRGAEKYGEKSCLKQQGVPLVTHKHLAGTNQSEVKQKNDEPQGTAVE